MAILLNHALSFLPGSPATTVTLTTNTAGADFIFAVGGFNDITQSLITTITDSEANVWTQIPGFPLSSDGHHSNVAASSIWYCSLPNTSTSHTITLTSLTGAMHGVLEVMAWYGIGTTPFNAQTWRMSGQTSTSLFNTLPSITSLVIAVALIGYTDPPNNSLATITNSSGMTLVDSVANAYSIGPAGSGHVGLSVAYQQFTISGTATITWGYPDMTPDNGNVGGGLFAFTLGVIPPPPLSGCTATVLSE